MRQGRTDLRWVWLGLTMALIGCASQPAPRPALSSPEPTDQEPAARRPQGPPLTQPSPEVLDKRYGLALLLPLSGDFKDLGEGMRDAALMALYDAYDPRLEIRLYDTEGTAEGARRAALAAVDGGAAVLLGPVFADNLKAVKPVARAAGLKIIGFSNDDSVAGDGTYLLSFPPEEQVARVVRFAFDLGVDRFAGLIPTSPYGDRVLAALGRSVAREGADLVQVEAYERARTALDEPVRRLADYDRRSQALKAERSYLESFGPDDDMAQALLKDLEGRDTLGDLPFGAVLVPEGEPLIHSLAPLLPFYDIDPDEVLVLGTGLWDGATLGDEAALNGALYAAPAPDRVDRHQGRFEALYGYEPPRLSTVAYDAVALAAVLIRSHGGLAFETGHLEDPQGFVGIDGLFRFQGDGLVQRGLAVMAVRPGGVELIDPPARSFFAFY